MARPGTSRPPTAPRVLGWGPGHAGPPFHGDRETGGENRQVVVPPAPTPRHAMAFAFQPAHRFGLLVGRHARCPIVDAEPFRYPPGRILGVPAQQDHVRDAARPQLIDDTRGLRPRLVGKDDRPEALASGRDYHLGQSVAVHVSGYLDAALLHEVAIADQESLSVR